MDYVAVSAPFSLAVVEMDMKFEERVEEEIEERIGERFEERIGERFEESCYE
jgi:hypothetical protein